MKPMRLWPFILATSCYSVAIALLVFRVGAHTRFQQFYCLDDTYIHLAVAKNLLVNHSFGVTPHVFAAVCSSVIWPFLVSILMAIFGVSSTIPLVMNVVLSIAVLFVCQRCYTSLQPHAPLWMQVFLQLSIVFSTSLIMLTFGGMEHVCQVLLDLMFLYVAARVLDDRAAKLLPALCVLGAFATATRYEGLFIVFITCLLLLFQRRVLASVAAGLASLVPVAGMGLYSHMHGSHFLPNSLIIKADPAYAGIRPVIFTSGQGILSKYSLQQGLGELFLVALGLLVLSFALRELLSRRTRYLLGIFVATCLLQSQFSRLGWVYRYEAYLIALGLFVLFNAAAELYVGYHSFPLARRKWVELCAGILLITSAFLVRRERTNIYEIPGGAQAIYEQQYQMARFLTSYYPGAPIAANDIGAITFLGDHDLVDLAGLASVEVADLKTKGEFTTDNIRRIVREHRTRMVVAYPHWYQGASALPSEWIPVGNWTLAPEHMGFVAGRQVTFYAVRPEEVGYLASSLRAFSSQLPVDVAQSGLYREGDHFARLSPAQPLPRPQPVPLAAYKVRTRSRYLAN